MKHNKAVAVCASNNSYAISISWGYPSVYWSIPFTWELPKIRTCCSKNLVTEIGMLLRAWNNCLGMNFPLASSVCRGRKKWPTRLGKCLQVRTYQSSMSLLCSSKWAILKQIPAPEKAPAEHCQHCVDLDIRFFSSVCSSQLHHCVNFQDCLGYQNTFFCLFFQFLLYENLAVKLNNKTHG